MSGCQMPSPRPASLGGGLFRPANSGKTPLPARKVTVPAVLSRIRPSPFRLPRVAGVDGYPGQSLADLRLSPWTSCLTAYDATESFPKPRPTLFKFTPPGAASDDPTSVPGPRKFFRGRLCPNTAVAPRTGSFPPAAVIDDGDAADIGCGATPLDSLRS